MLNYHVPMVRTGTQRLISFSRPIGYFKSESLLEGSRRLMPHKLALHVFVSFTEHVVPIHKQITVLYSEFPQHQQQKQSQ